jgi:hypothetical protein
MALVLLPLLTVAYAATVPFPQLRLPPAEVDSMQAHEAGSGTSGVAGIRTTVVAGEPSMPGPYTIRLTIPPNTRIQAHTHRDNRSAIVVAGVWYFGYATQRGTCLKQASIPAAGSRRCVESMSILSDQIARKASYQNDSDRPKPVLRLYEIAARKQTIRAQRKMGGSSFMAESGRL